MSEEKGYGLLISAIVSIVAIVGMVVLFSSGGSTGQAVSLDGGGGSHPTFGTTDRWGSNLRCAHVEAGFEDDYGNVCEGIVCMDGTTGASVCGAVGDNWGRPLSTKSERLSRTASQGYFDQNDGMVGSGGMYTQETQSEGAPQGKLNDQQVESESQKQYGRPMSMDLE